MFIKDILHAGAWTSKVLHITVVMERDQVSLNMFPSTIVIDRTSGIDSSGIIQISRREVLPGGY